jgi:hypothetical protein
VSLKKSTVPVAIALRPRPRRGIRLPWVGDTRHAAAAAGNRSFGYRVAAAWVEVVVGVSLAVGYALMFVAAAVGCAAGVVRARDVEDAETRRGLVVLLATSGGWAASHAALLALPTEALKTAVYLFGLILGFSTVFAWLYFCSAYTGRTYHRRTAYRWARVALYLGVVAVKVTNPLHHLYFTTGFVSAPFAHLAIQ